MLSFRTSEVYYACVNGINCTGQNMSKNLLLALGEADANMYLCAKKLRPSKYSCCPYHHISHDSVSVVRTTFKVYGKRQTLTFSQPKTPEPIVTKFEWTPTTKTICA